MTDFAAIRAKLAKTKASLKKAGTTIKPKVGKTSYVILPPYNSDGDWSHAFGVHYVKDEAGQTQAVYICNDRTHSAPCTICSAMAEAQRTVGVADPKMAEVIKQSYAAQRYLVGVLALDSDQPETPQVLEIGKKAFEQLVTLVESWTEQVFDPANPQIVTIERTGTNQNDTSYTVQPSPKRHAMKPSIKPIDLAEFVKQESDAAEKKAVLALKGLGRGTAALPAPSGSKAIPTTKPKEDEFEDVPNFPMTSAPAPAPAANLDTEDLDALLAGIDG